MTPQDDHLAALIGSRMCHDLVSPLGAIGNGLELLQMTQAPSEEMDLVIEAVKVAQARVGLFRLAFGAAGADQQISAAVVTQALQALAANGRITVHSDLSATLPRRHARRLALAALCVETALAWGGELTISPEGLSARAARLKMEPTLWEPLSQGAGVAELAPATVHFALLAQSGPVTVQATDEGLSITL